MLHFDAGGAIEAKHAKPELVTRRAYRFPWRPLLLLLLAAATGLVAFSYEYNYPIRFRPKWDMSPASHRVWLPSGPRPENIVLSPPRDPSTAMALNWRTSPAIRDGVVQYRRRGAVSETFTTVTARMTSLHTPELKYDTMIHCFAATLEELRPDTVYEYRVGSEKSDSWSPLLSFATLPPADEPVTVVFLGDMQKGIADIGAMLRDVEQRHQEVGLYLAGGDLVDMGEMRNLWDEFMAHTGDAFSRKPVAPTLGNHDLGAKRNALNIFDAYFNLPDNGRDVLPEGTAYSFVCGDASFIVLDSNRHLERQRGWLEAELQKAGDDARAFTVVMFHHPMFNVKKDRDDHDVRRAWGELFDRYGVDLVLTGHDHSYMRSKKLKNGRAVGDDEAGTFYVVANSCTKHHDAKRVDVAEVQIEDLFSYQLLAIGDDGGVPTLRFRTYAADGDLMDEFFIRKPR